MGLLFDEAMTKKSDLGTGDYSSTVMMFVMRADVMASPGKN